MTLQNRCLSVGLILLVIIETTAIGQGRAGELENAGLRKYHAGSFAEAEALFVEAMKEAVAANDKELEAVIRNDLGNVELGVDQPDRAYEDYTQALTIFSRMPDKPFELAATLRNAAAAQAMRGNYDEAQMSLSRAREILASHPALPDSQLLMAEVLNSQGIVLLKQEKFDKARVLFEAAIRTRTAAGMPEGLGNAQTLHNIGVIDMKKHNYADAERAFLKAIALTTSQLGPSHPDLTLTLDRLGELYIDMGRYNDANKQFERSLMILRGLNPPLYGRMVSTLGLAGVNYVKQGDERSAARFFQEAVDVSRSVRIDEPILPEILDTYADLLQKQGRVTDARDLHADAKRIRLQSALTVRAGR